MNGFSRKVLVSIESTLRKLRSNSVANKLIANILPTLFTVSEEVHSFEFLNYFKFNNFVFEFNVMFFECCEMRLLMTSTIAFQFWRIFDETFIQVCGD